MEVEVEDPPAPANDDIIELDNVDDEEEEIDDVEDEGENKKNRNRNRKRKSDDDNTENSNAKSNKTSTTNSDAAKGAGGSASISSSVTTFLNEITRNVLNQFTRGELLMKTLQLFEESGQKIKIKNPHFESKMRQVLIEKYDIKGFTL